MLLAIVFVLGVGNFAAQRAVLESGHPMLEELPGALHRGGGRLAKALEFGVLLAAMLLTANGWPAAAIGYGLYTALNILAAWLILSGRM